MTNAALRGKSDAVNPHVRFDEGEVASAATPGRGSLLYKRQTILKRDCRIRTLTTSVACELLMVAFCHAVDFPHAGGDIASDGADGWNGAKPGSGEEAKFTQSGTYTASANVTFGSVNFATDGLVFDLSSGNRAVTLDGATPVVGPTAANATTQLKGGSWSGTGMTFQSIGAGYTLRLTDGASIADAGTLSLGHGLNNNSVVLDGGSEIHANAILLHRWGSTGTKLDVGGGSKVYATGAFMVQQNGTPSSYFAGNHFVDVHGVGSLLQIGADLNFGQYNSDNVVRIRDEASLSVECLKKAGASSISSRRSCTLRRGPAFSTTPPRCLRLAISCISTTSRRFLSVTSRTRTSSIVCQLSYFENK